VSETDEIAAWLRKQAEVDLAKATAPTYACELLPPWARGMLSDGARDARSAGDEAARAESVTVERAGAGPPKPAEVLRIVVRQLACGYRHREGYRTEWKP
jgi:hypothetical protein